MSFKMSPSHRKFRTRLRPTECFPGTAGGCARGVSAERFETPLAGGAAASRRASGLRWRVACAAWGEPARPGLPPEGETGKGDLNFLAAAGIYLAHLHAHGWAPVVQLAHHTPACIANPQPIAA